MQNIYSFIALLTFSLLSAQVPQGISYQAIALNASGESVVNSNIGIRLSILEGTVSGTALYVETHLKTTNSLGLFNLVIGQGTVETGNFTTINWGTTSKFLKVEIDVAGGTDYVLVGTTQLLSVPYALAAGTLSGAGANNSIQDNKTSNFVYNSNSGTVYAYNTDNDTWTSLSATLASDTFFHESAGNAAFESASGSVYAFNALTNMWVENPAVPSFFAFYGSNGNFGYMSATAAHVFNKNTNSWSSQPGVLSMGVRESNGNFAFGATDGNVYAYNARTNTWVAQAGTIAQSAGLTACNGNFAFAATNGNVYIFNKNTNTWVSRPGTLDENVYPSGLPSN